MTGQLTGKVALVTGGSSGIGRATAELLAAEGATVIITNRKETSGRAAAEAICRQGGQATWIRADVTQAAQVEALFEEIEHRFGRLDIAFNNGGSGGEDSLLHELADADWQDAIAGYLTSAFLCMKYELRLMLAGQGGAIVNNASVDGHRGLPMDPSYSAAKHGLLGLTKSAALQYASRGIRINAVSPAGSGPHWWSKFSTAILTPRTECSNTNPSAASAAPKKSPPPFCGSVPTPLPW